MSKRQVGRVPGPGLKSLVSGYPFKVSRSVQVRDMDQSNPIILFGFEALNTESMLLQNRILHRNKSPL